jgi:hypothetical protein
MSQSARRPVGEKRGLIGASAERGAPKVWLQRISQAIRCDDATAT